MTCFKRSCEGEMLSVLCYSLAPISRFALFPSELSWFSAWNRLSTPPPPNVSCGHGVWWISEVDGWLLDQGSHLFPLLLVLHSWQVSYTQWGSLAGLLATRMGSTFQRLLLSGPAFPADGPTSYISDTA